MEENFTYLIKEAKTKKNSHIVFSLRNMCHRETQSLTNCLWFSFHTMKHSEVKCGMVLVVFTEFKQMERRLVGNVVNYYCELRCVEMCSST